MKNPQSRTTHKVLSNNTTKTSKSSKQEARRSSRKTEIISRYCKEIVGFWEPFLLHLGNITWNQHTWTSSERRTNESVVKEAENEAPTLAAKRSVLGRFSPSLRCVSFVRLRTICGKRKFFCFYFSYFFLFGCCIFLTAFSVQLVKSSLTHDVPWMLLRALSLIFILFFLVIKKWERIKSRIKWLLQ